MPVSTSLLADGIYRKSEALKALGFSKATWQKLVHAGLPEIKVNETILVDGKLVRLWLWRHADPALVADAIADPDLAAQVKRSLEHFRKESYEDGEGQITK